jgi:hypothetical protein
MKTIEVKVDKINDILKGTLAVEKKQKDDERKTTEKETSTKAENELEKEQKKVSKLKLPAPLKKLNPMDRIKKFLFNVLGGYIAVRLVDKIPMLTALIPKITAAMNFIEDWGGKIFNGLVTLVDKGYEMYDGLRGKVGEYFGEDGIKKFDEISGVLNKVINGVLIAGMVGLKAAQFMPKKPPDVKPPGGVPKGTKPGAVRRYTQRFGRDAAIKKFGKDAVKKLGGSAGRSAATSLARRGVVGALGKGGTRASLRFVKNFIQPIVKKIPLIGGLIDFALNYFVFKEPIGRAAFAAIGTTIFGALGATAGSVIPVAGNFVGGVLGGLAGDFAGKWLYDTFFSGKKPVKVPESDDDQLETTTPQAEVSGAQEMDLLKRLVAAEAETEGLSGMALVARSVLNRTGLIQSGKATKGTFLAKDDTVTGVIMGRNQYQPISDGRINNNFGDVTLENAEKAIELAQDINKLKQTLKTEGFNDSDISKLLAATGFRTGSAFSDSSQNVNVVKFKNHYFNTAGNSELKIAPANVDISSGLTDKSDAQTQADVQTTSSGSREQTEGSKLAGELGKFLNQRGLRWGSGVSEHPEHGGVKPVHTDGSYHYKEQGYRAIDIGGWGPKRFRREGMSGTDDQTKIIAGISEWNKMKGVTPIQFIHEGTDPTYHNDHVHIAYRKGGMTLGKSHLATLGEEGPEIVIDANSIGPAKDMLLAINQASTYDGVMKAIQDYAPYDSMASQKIMVPPPPQEQYGGGQTQKTVPIPIGDSKNSSNQFDLLYQGA